MPRLVKVDEGLQGTVGSRNERILHVQEMSQLRNLWLEAMTDSSDGEDPKPVFDSLQRKYQALADQEGHS